MRLAIITAAIAVFLITLTSCSNEGEPTGFNNVAFHSKINNPPANNGIERSKAEGTSAIAVSSIAVTDVRLLMSRLMLHVDHQADNVDNSLIHRGPLVMRATANSATFIAEAELTTNVYDNVKFEIHRFTTAELDLYVNDTGFSVFATDDRNTIVIDGMINDSIPFTYKTDIVANLVLPFDQAIVVNQNGVAQIAIVFDVASAFTFGGVYLDPTAPANKVIIDNQIRAAFKAAKM